MSLQKSEGESLGGFLIDLMRIFKFPKISRVGLSKSFDSKSNVLQVLQHTLRLTAASIIHTRNYWQRGITCGKERASID